MNHRLIACCRVAPESIQLFHHWLEHYSSYVERIVALVVHRPDETLSAFVSLAEARPKLRLYYTAQTHFDDSASMTALQKYVEAEGRYDWVIHADVDEFIEMEGIQGILEEATREDAHWIKGWIVDRFAVGGGIPPLSDSVPLDRQFPVWTSVTQKLCKAAAEKCSICLWPDIGSIHCFSNDWRNQRCARSLILVHHFKWHSDLVARTRKWIEDYSQTRKPWQSWIETRQLLLDHLDQNNQRVAIERYLWRNWVHGWFDYATWYEQIALESRDGDTLVEAGVWQGASLIHLAQACIALGRKVSIYGVDLFARSAYLGTSVPRHIARITENGSWLHIVANNLHRHGVLDAVNLLQMSIVRAACAFNDNSVFACYIDGAHDYGSVLSDIKAWWPKIRPGGYLSGHDWDHPEVKKAVSRFFESFESNIMCHGPTVWIVQKSMK